MVFPVIRHVSDDVLHIHNINIKTMRRREIIEYVQEADLLADVTPQDLAKEAKLGWLKKLLIIAIWPLIKPFIAKKIGERLANVLEDVLEGI